MVIEKNYQKVLDIFIEKNGNKPVDFFAVLKMDELIDKWSVLLAAQWVTEENRKESFNSLVSILIDTLSVEEVAEVARVGVIPISSHLIDLFLFDENSSSAKLKHLLESKSMTYVRPHLIDFTTY